VPPKGSFSIERFYQPIRRPLLHQNYPFGRRSDGLLISTSAFFFGSRDLSPFTDTDSREVIGSGSIIACAESQLTKSPATSETLFASTHQCRVCTSDFSLTTCKSDHADHIGKLMHAWQILVPGCSTSCSVTLLIHVALELHVHVHVCTCTSRVHAHSFPVVEWTTRDLTCRITGVVEWFPSCRADHS